MSDIQAQVRAVKASNENLCVRDVQLIQDVKACYLVSCGGESDNGNLREGLPENAQFIVLGPEIMPPLRYAVRLIHRNERDTYGAKQARKFQHQTLRGKKQKFHMSVLTFTLQGQHVLFSLAAVQCHSLYAIAAKLAYLVMHQGN